MKKLLLLPLIFTLVFSYSLNAQERENYFNQLPDEILYKIIKSTIVQNPQSYISIFFTCSHFYKILKQVIRTITIEAIDKTYHPENPALNFDFDLWRNSLHPITREATKPVLERCVRKLIRNKTEDQLNDFLYKIHEKRDFNYIEEVIFNKVFCEREFKRTDKKNYSSSIDEKLRFLISTPETKACDNRGFPKTFMHYIIKNIRVIEEQELLEFVPLCFRSNLEYTENAIELTFDVLKIINMAKEIKHISIRHNKIITQIPENIRYCYNTEKLYIEENPQLRSIPQNTAQLTKIKSITIMGCENIKDISPICKLRSLKNIDVQGLASLPESFIQLASSIRNRKFYFFTTKPNVRRTDIQITRPIKLKYCPCDDFDF